MYEEAKPRVGKESILKFRSRRQRGRAQVKILTTIHILIFYLITNKLTTL